MMSDTIQFNLSSKDLENQIRNHLAKQYPMKKEAAIDARLTYYDTFDWRLFHKSFVLYTLEDELILRKIGRDRKVNSLGTTTVPCFIWEFPKGDFMQHLEPVIEMRRLLRLVDLTSRITPYRILNKDEKTVAKLCFETTRLRSKKDPKTVGTQLWLKSIKGYPKHSKKVKNQIESLGITSSKDEEVFFKAMRESGRDPGSYSSKLHLQLTPDMRADEATVAIWRFLFQVIKTNEAHIEQDIDTEILHDFRVAIRRTRSALVWNKNIFSEKTISRFQKNFSWVGKISNELRDLDVYLLKKDEYKAMLSPVLRDDIDPLFDYLGKKRAASFHKTIRILNSKKYRTIMQDWQSFLDDPQYDLISGPSAKVPVYELASQRIYTQYRNVVKAGHQILENYDDEKLHKLRIQCKKLRYLIQFFSNLFSKKKIRIVVGQLKKLQDILGDYNDLSIQVNYLFDVAKEMPANLSRLNKTLISIGSLIGELETKRQSVKESFAQTFMGFSSPHNQKMFQDLFAQ
jgi:CHAD domain-containing protein